MAIAMPIPPCLPSSTRGFPTNVWVAEIRSTSLLRIPSIMFWSMVILSMLPAVDACRMTSVGCHTVSKPTAATASITIMVSVVRSIGYSPRGVNYLSNAVHPVSAAINDLSSAPALSAVAPLKQEGTSDAWE